MHHRVEYFISADGARIAPSRAPARGSVVEPAREIPVVADADVVFAEDTRRTSKLLERLGAPGAVLALTGAGSDTDLLALLQFGHQASEDQ